MIRHLPGGWGIRAGWLIAMIAVLVFWVAAGFNGLSPAPQTAQDGERHLLAFLFLVVLTFPLGLVWAGLLNGVAYLLEAFGYRAQVPDSLLIPLVWLGFVAIGYVQWFKLVPWLWRKRKAGRAGNARGSETGRH